MTHVSLPVTELTEPWWKLQKSWKYLSGPYFERWADAPQRCQILTLQKPSHGVGPRLAALGYACGYGEICATPGSAGLEVFVLLVLLSPWSMAKFPLNYKLWLQP